jgi:hypothetical protein
MFHEKCRVSGDSCYPGDHLLETAQPVRSGLPSTSPWGRSYVAVEKMSLVHHYPACDHLAWCCKPGSSGRAKRLGGKDKLRQALATGGSFFLSVQVRPRGRKAEALMTQRPPGSRRAAHPVPGPPAWECRGMSSDSSDWRSQPFARDCRLPLNDIRGARLLSCLSRRAVCAFFSGVIPPALVSQSGNEVPKTPQSSVPAPFSELTDELLQPHVDFYFRRHSNSFHRVLK